MPMLEKREAVVHRPKLSHPNDPAYPILTPREPERGNRRLLLDVPNRGNRLAMRFLNCAPPAVPGTPIDPGDGFLMRQGYTVA
jgi:hypothetical protein